MKILNKIIFLASAFLLLVGCESEEIVKPKQEQNNQSRFFLDDNFSLLCPGNGSIVPTPHVNYNDGKNYAYQNETVNISPAYILCSEDTYVDLVNIDLYKNGVFQMNIEDNVTQISYNAYNWTIPCNLEGIYTIRYSNSLQPSTHSNSQPFTITENPKAPTFSPNSGSGLSSININWDSSQFNCQVVQITVLGNDNSIERINATNNGSYNLEGNSTKTWRNWNTARIAISSLDPNVSFQSESANDIERGYKGCPVIFEENGNCRVRTPYRGLEPKFCHRYNLFSKQILEVGKIYLTSDNGYIYITSAFQRPLSDEDEEGSALLGPFSDCNSIYNDSFENTSCRAITRLQNGTFSL